MFDELQNLNKQKYSLAAEWINQNRKFKIYELLNKPNAKESHNLPNKGIKNSSIRLKSGAFGKVRTSCY